MENFNLDKKLHTDVLQDKYGIKKSQIWKFLGDENKWEDYENNKNDAMKASKSYISKLKQDIINSVNQSPKTLNTD